MSVDNISLEKLSEAEVGIVRIWAMDDAYAFMRAELEPLIEKVSTARAKATPEYLRFKKNVNVWQRRFTKAYELSGMITDIGIDQIVNPRRLRTTIQKRKELSFINLFRYLGLVESIGVSLVDMLVLMLVATGHDFHVERVHKEPRIVHASSFNDLKNATLASKLAFLRRNGLTECAKLIDRKLRNDIAHLSFEIQRQGKIKTKHYKELDIENRIFTFIVLFKTIILIMGEAQRVLSSRKKKGSGTSEGGEKTSARYSKNL